MTARDLLIQEIASEIEMLSTKGVTLPPDVVALWERYKPAQPTIKTDAMSDAQLLSALDLALTKLD